MMSGRRRALVSVTLALAIGVSVFAFAASNTVPATNAGIGSGNISGYTVTSVHYVLNADPTKVDQVTFTLAPATATTVKIKLVAAGSTWYDCTNLAGDVTCDTAGATVQPTDQLTVVATD
jgi:hypothetical protein